jgi:hypothetical protein
MNRDLGRARVGEKIKPWTSRLSASLEGDPNSQNRTRKHVRLGRAVGDALNSAYVMSSFCSCC